MLAAHENALVAALKGHRAVRQLKVRTVASLPKLAVDALLTKYVADAPAIYVLPGTFKGDDGTIVMTFDVAGVIRNVAGNAQARKGDGIDIGCDQLLIAAARALDGHQVGDCRWTLTSGEMVDDDIFDKAGIAAVEMRFTSSPLQVPDDWDESELQEFLTFHADVVPPDAPDAPAAQLDVDLPMPIGAALVPMRCSSVVTTFDATLLPSGASIFFAGRSQIADGGGGVFTYDATSTQTADDVLVFAPTGGGRLFRQGWTVFGFNDPVNARWAGAKFDNATDDTAAIQRAVNCLVAQGGGELRCPPNTAVISAQINVTNSVRFVAQGIGDTSTTATGPDHYLTRFLWNGSAVSTEAMILVKSAVANEYLWYFGIDGICLDGNNKAYVGLKCSSTRHFNIGALWAQKCRFAGWVIDNGNGVLGGAFCRAQDYTYAAFSNAAAIASHGVKITAVNATGLTGVRIQNLNLGTVNGNGLDVGDIDNCIFDNIHGSASGTGYDVYFRGLTDGQTRVSRKNYIMKFSGGKLYGEAKSNNWGEWVNSEGTSITLEPNAVFDYRVQDRINGRRWETQRYRVTDLRQLPIGDGYSTGGTAALTINGGMEVRVINLAAVGTNDWTWVVAPPNKEWSGGRITGATVWGVKLTNINGGNVAMQLGARQKTTRTGIGGALTTKNVTQAVDAAGTQTLESWDITFDAPIAYTFDSHVVVRIQRQGDDVADTYPDAYGIVSLALKYEADVGNSDSAGGFRYGFPVDKIV